MKCNKCKGTMGYYGVCNSKPLEVKYICSKCGNILIENIE